MPWPKCDESALVVDEIEIVVQVNGKLRDKIKIPAQATDEEMQEMALKSERLIPFLEGKKVVKVITVPKKLVNIVAK